MSFSALFKSAASAVVAALLIYASLLFSADPEMWVMFIAGSFFGANCVCAYLWISLHLKERPK